MVGWFVQNQHIYSAVHQQTELESGTFAARKLFNPFELVFTTEAVGTQAVASLLRLTIEFIQKGVI